MKVFVTMATGPYLNFSGRGLVLRKEVFTNQERAEREKEQWAKEALQAQEDEGILTALDPELVKVNVVELEVVDER